MKSTRRILCLIMVIAVCMTMAITAFAASASAGSYGTISGSCYQSAGYLPTSTTITTNPDSATLRITVRTTTSSNTQVASTSMTSAAGATSFSYTYPIVYHPDAIPSKASCTHYVVGSTEIYHTTSAAVLDTSYFT